MYNVCSIYFFTSITYIQRLFNVLLTSIKGVQRLFDIFFTSITYIQRLFNVLLTSKKGVQRLLNVLVRNNFSWINLLRNNYLVDIIINNIFWMLVNRRAWIKLFFFFLTLSQRLARLAGHSWEQLWRPLSLERASFRTSYIYFSESRLNFLQEKVVSKPLFSFAMHRGVRRRSETEFFILQKKHFSSAVKEFKRLSKNQSTR